MNDPIGFWALAFPAFVLVIVGLTAALRWADRRYPRFSRFLDDHWSPEPEPWRRW